MRARTQVGGRYAVLATLRFRLAARPCLQHADQVAAREPDQTVIERALARPVSGTAKAGWGFTNRTDFVTLGSGERVVLQRYRNPSDAGYRLRVMRGLRAPAAAAGIAIPRILESGLDHDPAWVIFDVLPGIPVPEAGDAAPGGPRFGEAARRMGELLAAFRQLPSGELAIKDLWANPVRLAASAAGWASQLDWLAAADFEAVRRADQRREHSNHVRDHALRNAEYIADDFLRDILPFIHQRDRDGLSQREFLRTAGSLIPWLGQDVLDTRMEFFELFGIQPESTLVAQRLLLAAKVV